MRRLRRADHAVTAVVAAALLATGVAGHTNFANAREDELRPADAIVVLAGEHDGREAYGISLAEAGWAPTVVLSNSYFADDAVMKRACAGRPRIEVICPKPDTLTTRGEAKMVRHLAEQRSWTTVIVVSWRYHLPRVRMIFRQCYSDEPGATVAVALPREYDFAALDWEFVYLYQFGAFVKAFLQGRCGS